MFIKNGAGKILRDNKKTVFVFSTIFGEHSFETKHIGINLDSGSVDEVCGYATSADFNELTDDQQNMLAMYIPIRNCFATNVIAITAKARSGKDYLAERLECGLGKYQTHVQPLGDPIREIDRIINGNRPGKNREQLISIGQGLRRVDPNVWIKTWLRICIDEYRLGNRFFICQDVRQPNEMEFFKNLGAFTIKIVANEKKRLEILGKLDGKSAIDESLLNDPTETHINGFEVDYVLLNEYDETFEAQIVEMVALLPEESCQQDTLSA